MLSLKVGQLVMSKTGRDRGTHYIVVGFEGDRVLVADGRSRLVATPKKKNSIHLQPYKVYSADIERSYRQHRKVTDLEVRQALSELLS